MVPFQKLGPEAGWQETDVPLIAKEPQGRAQKSGCSSERRLCIWEVVKYTLKFFPRCKWSGFSDRLPVCNPSSDRLGQYTYLCPEGSHPE